MTWRAVLIGSLPALVAVALVQATGVRAPQTVFKAEARVVVVLATVRGGNGRLIPDLEAREFAIFDDGKPVPLAHFSNAPEPIIVAVMIDTGLNTRLARGQEAATWFIEALGPDDRATVGTFGSETAVSPHLTSDRARLQRAIAEEVWPASISAPPWLGIDRAITALSQLKGRRIVLVLSGGGDWSHPSAGLVRRRAVEEDVMVYSLMFENTMLDRLFQTGCPGTTLCGPSYFFKWDFPPPGASLKPFAAETGGGHGKVLDRDHLPDLMAALAHEMRHQYVLGFVPLALDGNLHRLRVETTRRDTTVRARQRYLAR